MPQETALLSTLLTPQRITTQVFDRLLSRVVDTHIALLTDARTIVDEAVPKLVGESNPEFDQIRADLVRALGMVCAEVMQVAISTIVASMQAKLEDLVAREAATGRVVATNTSTFDQ
jgi:hypothetical protein